MAREYRHIQEYEKEIVELQEQGLTHREIGEKLGFTKEQIKEFIKRRRRKERKLTSGKLIKSKGRPPIADTVEDIYGFEISHETISTITDRVISTANDWQNRPLKKFYTFLFVDCLYVNIRKESETKNCAVYVVLGYDLNGVKDILGIWIGEAEGKHYWMQIFDEIKSRGVEDILFISMDGVSGLEEGAKSIFKDVVVQRCIVHMIRNSIKYVPTKDYKAFTSQLKKVYGASSLKAALAEFERFKEAWKHYPGAVSVCAKNYPLPNVLWKILTLYCLMNLPMALMRLL